MGDYLLEDKVITQNQLMIALEEQEKVNEKSKRKFKIGEIMMFLKYISLPQLQSYLLKQQPRTKEDTKKLKLLKEIKANPLEKFFSKLNPGN